MNIKTELSGYIHGKIVSVDKMYRIFYFVGHLGRRPSWTPYCISSHLHHLSTFVLNSLIVSRLSTALLYKTECMKILEANLSYEHIYLNIFYMLNKWGNSRPYNLAINVKSGGGG